MSSRPRGRCSGEMVLETSRGSFASGPAGRKYCEAQQCGWVIRLPDDDIVVIEFTRAVLECAYDSVSGTYYDALAVYDGATSDSPKLEDVSCLAPPPLVVSSGRYASVFFSADELFDYAGFAAEYTSGAAYCGAIDKCGECAESRACSWCAGSATCVPKAGPKSTCGGELTRGPAACCPANRAGPACAECARGHYGEDCAACSCDVGQSCVDGRLGDGACVCGAGKVDCACGITALKVFTSNNPSCVLLDLDPPNEDTCDDAKVLNWQLSHGAITNSSADGLGGVVGHSFSTVPLPLGTLFARADVTTLREEAVVTVDISIDGLNQTLAADHDFFPTQAGVTTLVTIRVADAGAAGDAASRCPRSSEFTLELARPRSADLAITEQTFSIFSDDLTRLVRARPSPAPARVGLCATWRRLSVSAHVAAPHPARPRGRSRRTRSTRSSRRARRSTSRAWSCP